MQNINKELKIAIDKQDVEEAEKIIEKYLKDDPSNINLWLRLAVTVINVPLVDYNKSLECLDKVYELNPSNLVALILEVYIHIYCLGGVDERLYNKLKSVKTEDKEILSIIKYLMSEYYRDNNVEKRLCLLKESIFLCDRYTSNYEELAQIYLKKGKKIKAKNLLEKGYQNVISTPETDALTLDFTNVKNYINEFVIRIDKSTINRDSMEQLITQLDSD